MLPVNRHQSERLESCKACAADRLSAGEKVGRLCRLAATPCCLPSGTCDSIEFIELTVARGSFARRNLVSPCWDAPDFRCTPKADIRFASSHPSKRASRRLMHRGKNGAIRRDNSALGTHETVDCRHLYLQARGYGSCSTRISTPRNRRSRSRKPNLRRIFDH
jgi:hypothetical protein